ERAVAAVPEQPVPGLTRDRWFGKRAAVDEEDVNPPVVVEIEEQAAGPDGFRQVLVGAGAVDLAEVHPGAAADVGEPDVFFLALHVAAADRGQRNDRNEPATSASHLTGLPPRRAASSRKVSSKSCRRRSASRCRCTCSTCSKCRAASRSLPSRVKAVASAYSASIKSAFSSVARRNESAASALRPAFK